MPRLPALLLSPLLLLASPAAQAGNVLFEGVILRGNGVELRIGNHRYIPHGWAHPSLQGHRTWHHGWQDHSSAWGHSRLQQRWPPDPHWDGGRQVHQGYNAQDIRQVWRQGFEAGRRSNDGPRWHGSWSG